MPEDLGARVTFQPGDIARMVLPQHTFDCAVDMCTLQHLTHDDAVEAVRSIHRALKPGGRLLSVMAAVGYEVERDDPVAPRLVTDHEVWSVLFPQFVIRVGRETIERPDGRILIHFIVEAQK